MHVHISYILHVHVYIFVQSLTFSLSAVLQEQLSNDHKPVEEVDG